MNRFLEILTKNFNIGLKEAADYLDVLDNLNTGNIMNNAYKYSPEEKKYFYYSKEASKKEFTFELDINGKKVKYNFYSNNPELSINDYDDLELTGCFKNKEIDWKKIVGYAPKSYFFERKLSETIEDCNVFVSKKVKL